MLDERRYPPFAEIKDKLAAAIQPVQNARQPTPGRVRTRSSRLLIPTEVARDSGMISPAIPI